MPRWNARRRSSHARRIAQAATRSILERVDPTAPADEAGAIRDAARRVSSRRDLRKLVVRWRIEPIVGGVAPTLNLPGRGDPASVLDARCDAPERPGGRGRCPEVGGTPARDGLIGTEGARVVIIRGDAREGSDGRALQAVGVQAPARDVPAGPDAAREAEPSGNRLESAGRCVGLAVRVGPPANGVLSRPAGSRSTTPRVARASISKQLEVAPDRLSRHDPSRRLPAPAVSRQARRPRTAWTSSPGPMAYCRTLRA